MQLVLFKHFFFSFTFGNLKFKVFQSIRSMKNISVIEAGSFATDIFMTSSGHLTASVFDFQSKVGSGRRHLPNFMCWMMRVRQKQLEGAPWEALSQGTACLSSASSGCHWVIVMESRSWSGHGSITITVPMAW